MASPKTTAPKAEPKPGVTPPSDAITPPKLVGVQEAMVPTALHDVTPFDRSKLQVKQRYTVPVFSIVAREKMLIKTVDEIVIRPMSLAGTREKAVPTPMLQVIDLETGEEGLLILGAVLNSALGRAGTPLKGRIFGIAAGTIKEGKSYRDYEVVELEESAG